MSFAPCFALSFGYRLFTTERKGSIQISAIPMVEVFCTAHVMRIINLVPNQAASGQNICLVCVLRWCLLPLFV